jgi:hypothetical protein
MKKYYVVMSMKLFADIKTNLGISLSDQMPDGSIGFLPIYPTLEKAKETHPDHKVYEVEATETEANQ